jgi:hypothetical protein
MTHPSSNLSLAESLIKSRIHSSQVVGDKTREFCDVLMASCDEENDMLSLSPNLSIRDFTVLVDRYNNLYRKTGTTADGYTIESYLTLLNSIQDPVPLRDVKLHEFTLRYWYFGELIGLFRQMLEYAHVSDGDPVIYALAYLNPNTDFADVILNGYASQNRTETNLAELHNIEAGLVRALGGVPSQINFPPRGRFFGGPRRQRKVAPAVRDRQ